MLEATASFSGREYEIQAPTMLGCCSERTTLLFMDSDINSAMDASWKFVHVYMQSDCVNGILDVLFTSSRLLLDRGSSSVTSLKQDIHMLHSNENLISLS